MSDEIEQILKQPLPTSYDALIVERERIFELLNQVHGDINRISRDLAANSLPGARRRGEKWVQGARHAKRCLGLKAEQLKNRHGQISRLLRTYREHKFIVEARRQLPADTFNSIMDATRRRQSRRASA